MRWLMNERLTVIEIEPGLSSFVTHPYLPGPVALHLHQLLSAKIGPPTPVKPENDGVLAEAGKFVAMLAMLVVVMAAGLFLAGVLG